MEQHLSLFIEGMSDSASENAIKKVLLSLNGIKNVIVNLSVKKVLVEYDDERISIEIIKGKIEDQGYVVK